MSSKEWVEANQDKMRVYRREYYYKNRDKEKARSLKRRKLVEKEIREYLQNIKISRGCLFCGEDHVACLDFHHIDPNEKEETISAIPKRGWSYERIDKELEKCIVLCSNCHRKLHYAGQG